jgi:DNA-binding transcriptional LysR family regulator
VVIGVQAVELRQLHYFVTLAEELHFGRAAAREHVVPSALSQQIQRLERELGVALVERNTHHVRLTRPGSVFLTQARGVLGEVERAVIATQRASSSTAVARVAIGDASLDSMPQVLRHVQYNNPELVIHRIEASVPEQYRMLHEARLDIGVGRATHAPAGVASEVFRHDCLGVMLAGTHRLAHGDSVAVARLAGELLLLAEPAHAPEFNDFVLQMCAAAGFPPRRFHGSAQSVRAAAELVGQQRCVLLVPRSCDLLMPGIRWLPLVDPVVRYPWSLLWRSGDESCATRAVVDGARALSRKLGWLSADDEHACGNGGR